MASACCGRRPSSASDSRGRVWPRSWEARRGSRRCRTRSSGLAAHELVARASTPARQATSSSCSPTPSSARRRTPCSPTRTGCSGHRLAGDWLEQAGAGGRDGAGGALPPRGGAGARRRAGTSARRRRPSSANDLVAAIERAELGIAGGAAGELAGKLRLIAAEAHVWRGELAEAERRALAAAADLPVGQRRLAARAGAGDHRRGQARPARGASSVEVRLVEASPLTADPAVRSARIICLAWGAQLPGLRRAPRASPIR